MKTATIQGEKYNASQLFLMSKLEAECLPKARVILGAYEIAEWMEAYAAERLRDELIAYTKWLKLDIECEITFVDEYLKSKQ